MNTYIYAYSNAGDPVEIHKVVARSYNDAKDKILTEILGDDYGDFEYTNDEDWLAIGDRVYQEFNINLSDIHELEEFE